MTSLLNEAFSKVDVPKTPKSSKPVVEDAKRFSRELSTLTYGIYRREHEVKSREEARSRNADADPKRKTVTTFSDIQSMFSFVDDEIQNRLQKTQWKRLSNHYKLKSINAYVDTLPDLSKKDKVKIIKLLTSSLGLLDNVQYTPASQTITLLNFEYEGKVI